MTYRNSVAALNALRPRCPHCRRPPEPGESIADHYEIDHDRWLCDAPTTKDGVMPSESALHTRDALRDPMLAVPAVTEGRGSDDNAHSLFRPVLLTAWKGHGRSFGAWHVGGFQPRCGYVPPDGAPCTEIRVPLEAVVRTHLDGLCNSCGKLLAEDLKRD